LQDEISLILVVIY